MPPLTVLHADIFDAILIFTASDGATVKDVAMTTDTIEQPQPDRQPVRSRAVFSQEDFGLIRTAIAHYLREVQDQPESVKYANLYHRLGRVA